MIKILFLNNVYLFAQVELNPYLCSIKLKTNINSIKRRSIMLNRQKKVDVNKWSDATVNTNFMWLKKMHKDGKLSFFTIKALENVANTPNDRRVILSGVYGNEKKYSIIADLRSNEHKNRKERKPLTAFTNVHDIDNAIEEKMLQIDTLKSEIELLKSDRSRLVDLEVERLNLEIKRLKGEN